MAIRALRGATTVEEDAPGAIEVRVHELLAAMLARNEIGKDRLVSILFTATDDLHSMFPAAAARSMGLGDVPLICARELDIHGAVARCIRVMMHLEDDRPRDQLHHVYLHGAVGLRDDLPA
jgi:chorismate mutase